MRILLALLLASCAAAPLQPVLERPKTSSLPTKLDPPWKASVLSALGAGSKERGFVRQFWPAAGPCPWRGVTPFLLLPRTEPRVGTPLRCSWRMDGMLIPNANGILEPVLVSVLMAFKPLPEPIQVASGCWLLVPWDHVLVPQPTGWLRYDPQRGRVDIDFTPAPGLEGVDFYMQLLVKMPGANSIDHVLSGGVQIHIGGHEAVR